MTHFLKAYTYSFRSHLPYMLHKVIKMVFTVQTPRSTISSPNVWQSTCRKFVFLQMVDTTVNYYVHKSSLSKHLLLSDVEVELKRAGNNCGK